MNIDPLAEQYYTISLYTYVSNNPVRFIDPNRMEIKDPDKIVKTYKGKLNQAIADIKSYMKAGTIDAKFGNKLIGVNENALKEISVLEKSSQVYTVNSDSGEGGGIKYDNATGEIKVGLGTNDKGVVYHELGHAYQYETGKLSLSVDNSKYGSL